MQSPSPRRERPLHDPEQGIGVGVCVDVVVEVGVSELVGVGVFIVVECGLVGLRFFLILGGGLLEIFVFFSGEIVGIVVLRDGLVVLDILKVLGSKLVEVGVFVVLGVGLVDIDEFVVLGSGLVGVGLFLCFPYSA